MGEWPDAYWSETQKPPSRNTLKKSINALYKDLKVLRKLLQKEPLLAPLPYGEKKHTLAREVMILSNHLAYHLGQMVALRRALGIWE